MYMRSSSSATSGAALFSELRHALLHLFHRQVLLVRADRPDMAERIDDRPHAIAIELIGDRTLNRGAGSHRLRERLVDILDVQQQADARAAERLRAAIRVVLVGEHYVRIADPD